MEIVQQILPQVQSLPIWIEYVKALGTPIAALVAAFIGGFIAYRQMQTAKNKLKLDLFDKRVKVYEAAVDLIKSVGSLDEMEENRSEEIVTSLNSASWLLDDKVDAHLVQLEREINKQRRKVRSALSGNEKIALVSENRNFRDKHRAELMVAFKPFLKLQH
jgi:ABC-type multidrug transport system fused ATPase/permease subunit